MILLLWLWPSPRHKGPSDNSTEQYMYTPTIWLYIDRLSRNENFNTIFQLQLFIHNLFTEEELVVDTDDEYQYEEVPIDEIFIGTGKLDI